MIDNLTKEGKTSNGKPVSFDVIVPNLPGFGLSSAPPGNWTNQDTARVFNTLMTNVLGYKKYATHGTDWGCATAYDLYDSYNSTVRATHLASLPFVPLTPDQLAAEGITLNALETFEEESFIEWSTNGYAYFQQETTKVSDDPSSHQNGQSAYGCTQPNTIGLALYDNPVGQLAYMGEKFLNCE